MIILPALVSPAPAPSYLVSMARDSIYGDWISAAMMMAGRRARVARKSAKFCILVDRRRLVKFGLFWFEEK